MTARELLRLFADALATFRGTQTPARVSDTRLLFLSDAPPMSLWQPILTRPNPDQAATPMLHSRQAYRVRQTYRPQPLPVLPQHGKQLPASGAKRVWDGGAGWDVVA